MRHKYLTTALVLGRIAHGEANTLLIFLTPDLGLIRVRAQGIRKPGAKLAHAVQTFSQSDVTLIRGKDGWRLAGALPSIDYYHLLSNPARERAARVGELLIRFVHGESQDPRFYSIVHSFIEILPTLSEEDADAAECLVVLRLLRVLGLDAGELPEGEGYGEETLAAIRETRKEYVARINRGIAASGL